MPPAKTATSKPVNNAKHAFLYLTSFSTLALVAFNIRGILFQIINYYFPEEFYSWDVTFSQDFLKFAISTLIIAAPVYYFVTRLINRHLSKKDLDQDSGIRRWLTYIVMFIAIGTVIGDLIAAVYSFLDGEMTVRFTLKVLTILVIAGGIFLYYFMDMKNADQNKRNDKNSKWGMFLWVLVLIPLIWAFVVMENPKITRLKKIDSDTTNSLQQVMYSVENFYRSEKRLPIDVKELQAPNYYLSVNMNDLLAKNFQYIPGEERNYQLCADFERNSTKDDSQDIRYSYSPETTNWQHPSGHHCFDLRVPQDF